MGIPASTRRQVESDLKPIVEDAISSHGEVSVKVLGSVSAAEQRYSGVYASLSFNASVTREELDQLAEEGVHMVEQIGHATENPDMDSDIESVDVAHLRDAVEVETELIVELSDDYL